MEWAIIGFLSLAVLYLGFLFLRRMIRLAVKVALIGAMLLSLASGGGALWWFNQGDAGKSPKSNVQRPKSK